MAEIGQKLTVGSLFAGIGGFDLAAEQIGFDVGWQVEIDPFCLSVLEKHWPAVARLNDVRNVHGVGSCEENGCEWCVCSVDIVCAGIPCQPVCNHGHRKAEQDSRWLWPHVYRLMGELEPGYLVLENVSALLRPGRGFDRILADLAVLGYDAEWECVPATAVGATHYRERVWLVAYRSSDGLEDEPTPRVYVQGPRRNNVDGCRTFPPRRNAGAEPWRAYTESDGPEPGILREAYGLSGGMDRVRALGNAIVPQVAEWIFRRILEAEADLVRLRHAGKDEEP